MTTLERHHEINSVVSGPYDSRRFGRSLGVNPLPNGSRLCNFDCVYCDCATGSWPLEWQLRPQYPTVDSIHHALLEAAQIFDPDQLDSIVISGNGEPTLSPHLDAVVDVVNAARDRDWPQARTVILSNGTTCHKAEVRAALVKVDERVIKLDAGTNWILEQLNRPAGKLTIGELVRRISALPDVAIHSIFVHGPVDNTKPGEIAPWARWLERIRPVSVQIYSLDRPPAKSWVRAVSRKELEWIAEYLQSATGIPAHVF